MGWSTGVRRTPLRTTATDSSGRTRPPRARARSPATPAVPVSSASIPVAPQASGVGLEQGLLVDDDRAPAGDEHRPHHREPVVGLVVQDPVGDAHGLRLPRPHVARPPVRDAMEAIVDRAGVDRGTRGDAQVPQDALPGADERPAAGGLHRVQARDGVDGADGGRVVEPERDPRCERPAADLDDDPVEGTAGRAQLVGDLPGQGRPALDREAVVRSLAGERDGALGEGLLQPQVRGIARLAGSARADDDDGPELPQPVDRGGVRAGGDEHAQLALGCPGENGSGQGGVAAARDGEGRSGIATGHRLGNPQLEQDPEQVACLVRARHVAGLVLDPDRTLRPQPGGVRDPRRPDERRDAEPAAVHAGDGVVELAHEVHVAGVAPACGAGDVVGVEQGAVPDERVRVGVRRGIQAVEVDAAGHHVVDVVAGTAARAAGRERMVGRREGAAAGAGERRSRPRAAVARPAGGSRLLTAERSRSRRPPGGPVVELVDQLVPAAARSRASRSRTRAAGGPRTPRWAPPAAPPR